MKYLSSFSFLFLLCPITLLSAISSNIEDGNSINPVVSILNMRSTTSQDIIDVDTLSDGKLLWKYDSNEFVSGDDTKGWLVTLPDSLRYIQDGNSYNLCLKNDTICWTGIENRQTRIFFNPPIPLFTSINKRDSITINFEGLVEYGNYNKWQRIKGYSNSRVSETGILSDGISIINGIRCISIETIFNTIPNDSLSASREGYFCYKQNIWVSPAYPLPILRSCSLLRLDSITAINRDSTLLSERYVLYTPENQAYDNIISSDSITPKSTPIDYTLVPIEDNPTVFPIHINSITNTTDGIKIDATAECNGDIPVSFTLFTINGHVLTHQQSIIPQGAHLYQHLCIPDDYTGIVLLNIGYGSTSCGYRFVR